MPTIKTHKQKEFAVRWCGVSSIDSSLRFGIINDTISNVIATFLDAEEASEITYWFDDTNTVYTGYTTLIGVDLQNNGDIVVSLKKSE